MKKNRDEADDAPLKSSLELAMERLQAADRAAGVEGPKPLTAAQKKRIAELRGKARAKLAELEILHRDQLTAAGGDPEKIAELKEQLQVDRDRIERGVEADVERVKRG